MPAEPTGQRLSRLLALVPWVIANPGTTVTEACRRFGVTREEVLADLDLLFVCGLPPFGPGDLIEAHVDGEEIHIDMADYFSRPMRLTRLEAVTMLVMGRAIAGLPGLEESRSLLSALGKLEGAVARGEAEPAVELAQRVAVDLEREATDVLVVLRDAIAGGIRVRIEYYSAGRDAMTERVVCPLRVRTAQGRWYVEAHDELSKEERLFRVDRIREITPLAEPCPPEVAAGGPERPPALFVASDHDQEVIIELAPGAASVREGIPHDGAEELNDGWVRMTLRTPHLAWIERLLLRLGTDARVIAPPELAAGVRELAGRMLARYERG